MRTSKRKKSEFGKRLELALEMYNKDHADTMTYAELSKRIGVSTRKISDWLYGNRNPTEKNVQRTAYVLEVPFDWLQTGTHYYEYPLSVEEYKNRIIEIVSEIDDVAVLAGIADSIEDLLKLVPSAYMNGGFRNQSLFKKPDSD